MTDVAAQEQPLVLVNVPSRRWGGTAGDLRDVYRHRGLLRAFVARQLRARYKGTGLGWVWALIRPLTMLLIYGVAVGIFLGAGRVIPQYMIFIYSGLLAWTLFSTIVMSCIGTVIENGPLLTRAAFPRLLLPLSALVVAMVDFVLQASVLAVGYLIFQDLPSPSQLAWLVPSLLILVLFAFALGLALSAINVYVRDIAFLADVGLQVGFWAAPVLYSYGQVVRGASDFGLPTGLVTQAYMSNPMASVVLGFQRALWPAATSADAAGSGFPGELGLRLAILSVVMLALTWLGLRIFVRLSGNFGQEL